MNTIRINLLPWRDEERLMRENTFKRILVYSSLVGVLIGLLGLVWMKLAVDQQKNRVVAIDTAIQTRYKGAEQLLAENEKIVEELRERLRVLGELTDQRNKVVQVMEDLASAEVEGIFIYGLDFEVDKLIFGSISDSNDALVDYLDVLENKVGLTPIPDFSENNILGKKLIDVSLEISPSDFEKLNIKTGE